MDLNLISTFVRVVEAGSFAAAARQLSLPRSSVSRAVDRLESKLGVQLLTRSTRKLSLTGAGQAYYEQVRGAVDELRAASSDVAGLGREPRGHVKLTSVQDAGDVLGLAGHIAAFAARHPRISVELLFTGRQVDLVGEGVDLAIRAGPGLADSSLKARKLLDAPCHFYASPDYLARRGAPRQLEDLAEHEHVLFRARESATVPLRGPDGPARATLRGRVCVDSMPFATELAARGVAIALVPEPEARARVERGELVTLLGEYAVVGSGVWLVWPPSERPQACVALLREHLIEAICGANEPPAPRRKRRTKK